MAQRIGYFRMYASREELHEKNGKRWISLPAREYTDQQGARQFAPFLSFADRTTSDRFQRLVLAAVDAELAESRALAS